MSNIDDPYAAVEPTAVPDALDRLFAPFNRGDAPGLMVGVAQNGRVVYRRGFGLSSVELGVANTPTTRSRIGSTSKHFACLAALLLAEEGRLDIDSLLSSHFPELPVLEGEPTLRHLMTNTSGLRCYLSLGFLANGMAIRPPGAAMAMQLRQREANFAPGERLMYNNSGFHLLSLIIERVSGMPFERFLKERIFDPLGMIDTVSVPSDLEVHSRVAGLYLSQPDGGYRRGIFPTEEIKGEGGAISTVDDMLLWLAHLRGAKRIGSDATWEQMTSQVKLNSGCILNYGLGLLRHDYRGVEVIHHPGGVVGGSSQMLTVPSHRLDIIIIANSDTVGSIQLAWDVVDTVLGNALGPHAATASSDQHKSLLGRRYFSASRQGFQFGFVDLEGKLGLSIMNGQAWPLKADGDRVWLDALDNRGGGPYELVLPDTTQAAPSTLMLSDGGEPHAFHLLPESPPSTREAGAYLVGRYRANDLDADAEIKIEGECLIMRIHGEFGTNVMELEAFSHDLFGWTPRGRPAEVGTLHVRRDGDKVTSLLIDTIRIRHLLVERLSD